MFRCYPGLSSASLQITESENGATSGIFSGNLSLDVSEGSKWNITRSGFCGMRSKKAGFFFFLSKTSILDLINVIIGA